ncbi:MAG: HDOD domain-containing protein [Candidatus Abyssobacteria bacterium SURF_17]|uniref:HDOD domain-containing protein n=1 Tax=Candidatus Abyssobacteria bacterium SURF_17 TaxID=2093361 RepID=A0A419F0V9_9BACT|nr:MAG: HDOD domain-containing protein [Candidatus Abyssubacteria bacterium SURF_17]
MDIKEISTLPQVMARIMEIITDESSSASDLASEIAKDKSLTAKILKMVNSAYYGFYREIVKVSDAVVVLGFNEIRRLSLAISVLDMFGGSSQAEHRVRLWNHSLTCAAMSDILVKEWRMGDKGAFTAGLLHDTGKAVLDQYFPSMFSAVQACMREQSLSAHEAERMLFGFDHGDIGFWLFDRWSFPITLSKAIQYHHRVEAAQEAADMARLVHVADRLANEFVVLKSAGVPMTGVSWEEGEEPSFEEKVSLLLELEKRMRSTASATMFL